MSNDAALLLKLKELTDDTSPDADAAWLETLAVTGDPLGLDDSEQDLKRELALCVPNAPPSPPECPPQCALCFARSYNQALAGVKTAQQRLDKLGVPHVRPDDYFAEMLKTDKHMLKIKRRMVNQQQEIISAEERRKSKANKKFGKQVQRETLVARQQQKKRDIAQVTALRKSSKGKSGTTDFDLELDGDGAGAPGGKRQKTAGGPSAGKREWKNQRFGKAGKRGDKKNSSESTDDLRGFNRGGKGKGGGKGKDSASSSSSAPTPAPTPAVTPAPTPADRGLGGI